MRTHTKSREYYERIKKVTPGTQSNLRRMPGYEPLCMVRGEGSHIWDIDSNEYIDYIIGVGPGILGYGNPVFTQALKGQIDTMYFCATSGFTTDKQLELCEKFIKHTPCAEKVRFGVTGSEAVQLAIRLARGYTGRQYFIRFESQYHGWPDNVFGGMVNDNPVGKPFGISTDQDPMRTKGRYSEAFHESFMLPWNNIDVLEDVLEKYGDEIAMVLMDPIPQSHSFCLPLPGFLERIRELCDKYGIVLCFDEVMTGFRVGLNSAQGLLGVTPDIATFGKAIAAGMPLSAIAGKSEIMDLLLEEEVIGAGTFNGYPLSIAASLATLGILEKDDGAYYKKRDKIKRAN